jgi:hypothetical protein
MALSFPVLTHTLKGQDSAVIVDYTFSRNLFLPLKDNDGVPMPPNAASGVIVARRGSSLTLNSCSLVVADSSGLPFTGIVQAKLKITNNAQTGSPDSYSFTTGMYSLQCGANGGALFPSISLPASPNAAGWDWLNLELTFRKWIGAGNYIDAGPPHHVSSAVFLLLNNPIDNAELYAGVVEKSLPFGWLATTDAWFSL